MEGYRFDGNAQTSARTPHAFHVKDFCLAPHPADRVLELGFSPQPVSLARRQGHVYIWKALGEIFPETARSGPKRNSSCCGVVVELWTLVQGRVWHLMWVCMQYCTASPSLPLPVQPPCAPTPCIRPILQRRHVGESTGRGHSVAITGVDDGGGEERGTQDDAGQRHPRRRPGPEGAATDGARAVTLSSKNEDLARV